MRCHALPWIPSLEPLEARLMLPAEAALPLLACGLAGALLARRVRTHPQAAG